jgi:hypothetical protein
MQASPKQMPTTSKWNQKPIALLLFGRGQHADLYFKS